MEIEFNDLLLKLNTTGKETANSSLTSDEISKSIANKATSLEQFNKKYENTFRFGPVKIETKKQLIEAIHNFLLASSNKLKWTVDSTVDADALSHHSRLICSSLDTIRLVSRDTDGIEAFEHEELLALVQRIADLTTEDETHVIQILTPPLNSTNASSSAATASTTSTDLANETASQEQSNETTVVSNEPKSSSTDTITSSRSLLRQDIIAVAGLKAISNLIYNSKYAQEFYARNGVAETITKHLKQFTPDSISETNVNQVKIMVFNLRILFLLTIFNKELRQKLREKLQVVTYLIEIMDQIMKERLNSPSSNQDMNDSTSISININATSVEDEQTRNDMLSDYCYLKKSDIDYIIEILKILYNLTMDTPSVRANAEATMMSTPLAAQSSSKSANNEEEEAHLMHLVSVLRDLITCKEEEAQNPAHISKINDLHSNIINLLTNMPSICFEELMTPCLNLMNDAVQVSDEHLMTMVSPALKSSSYLSSENLNVRLAHNRKRVSRRSRRMKKKQEEKATSDDTSASASPTNVSVSTNKTRTPSSSDNADVDELIGLDEDFEFEGKNMEAIGMILLFMNRNVSIYLKKPATYNADQLYPVLLLLSLMSKANAIIRRYCRYKVLPPLGREVTVLPQEGNTIRNRLVRLMTDANIQIKRLSAQFLFILCKESVNRLIKYTGYGNSAGLLAEAGLMLSKHGDRAAYSSDSDDSDTEEYKKLEDHVNPITGRAEFNKLDLFEGMSEEQKEYDAMEIVKTIDKLTRMGSASSGGIIKPATIGPDGKPVEIEHVLQLQEPNKLTKKKDSE